MRNRRLVVLLLVSFMLVGCFAGVGSVFGNSDIFGYSNYSPSYPVTLSANVWYGINFTVPYATDWYTNTIAFQFRVPTGLTNVSYVVTILDSAKQMLYHQHDSDSYSVENTNYVSLTGVFTFEAGQTYWLGLVTNATTVDGTGDNYVVWVDDSNSYSTPVSPTDAVREGSNGLAIWAIVVDNISELDDVSPTASSGGGAGSDDSWFTGGSWSGIMGWIAVLLIMLIPPFILGVYMRGGKWGFLIGLAIGTGLSYFVFPLLVPIWLVILVAIGLGAAFLTSVKQGG